MSKQIAILHYASPPTVGGVEATIAHHARGLIKLGYRVRVISGDGAVFDNRIESKIYPSFASRHEDVLTVKKELDKGIVSEAFHELVAKQAAYLREALQDCELCIVHNIHSLNKNLSLTAALASLEQIPLIAWVHDMAWSNPQYQHELYEGYPWNLLRQKWANSRYVTVSEARQAEFAQLMGIQEDEIAVVTAGVDIAAFMQWTESMQMIEEKLQLLSADLLLLLPARLTRRKNIEFALCVLDEVRRENHLDCRLIVTGPPGPHNPTNKDYLGELLALRQSLDLQNAAHFLYELEDPTFIPDDTTMANLYQTADALFFPSLDEGLGIPILEAGFVGLPIFCSDLPPFRQTGQDNLNFFDPRHDSPAEIARMINAYFSDNPRERLKRRVRHNYRWELIVRNQIIPLVEAL
jgi:glycosyltransferase involved in cell wall biosynthesis